MHPQQLQKIPTSLNRSTYDDVTVGEAPVAALGRIGANQQKSVLVPKSLDDLDQGCMPCVALLTNGNGIALLDCAAGDGFSVSGANGRVSLKREALASVYANRILMLEKVGQTAKFPLLAATPGSEGVDIRLHAIFAQVLKSSQVMELLVVAVLSNLFVFALPLFSMAVYDRIIPHKAYETLWAFTVGLLIVLVLDFAGRMLRTRVQEIISHEISAKAQRTLFSRVLSTDVDHAPKSASSISGALSAVEAACHLAPPLLVGFLIDLPFIVLLFVYIGWVAKFVVIVPLVSTAIICASSFLLHLVAKRSHAETSRQNIEHVMLIEESISSFVAAKVTTAQPAMFMAWSRVRNMLMTSATSSRNATALASQISAMIIQLNTILALVVGVFMISAGDMTVGALVSAVMLSGRALSPMINIVTGCVRTASLLEPLNLARTLMSLPPEQAGDQDRIPTRLRGDITMQAVELRYPDAPSLSLRGVDLTIAAGERVAIIGKIGSGKSTLAKLLPRLHVPSSGSVLIDGQDVRQFDPHFLRKQISFMPQDCDLFDASIRENIVKGLGQVDENAFDEAVRVSGVRDIVASHPHGYDLPVGRGGRRLSGGERQAVCMARALARCGSVLVMDEPTSAMDSQMEQAVVARLKHHLDGKTVIIATHRTPLLALVDRVIWLNNGKIVADGPPSDIIARAARVA